MKKLFAILLALSLVLSFSVSAEGYWSKDDEPATLSYWVALSSYAAVVMDNYKDNLVYSTIMDQSNLTIEFTHPTIGQEGTSFNLLMMSDSLPDIIEYSWGSYEGGAQKALDDGIILPLNDLLPELAPDAYALMTKSDDIRKQCTTDAGTFYAFFGIVNSTCIPNGMFDDRIQGGPILRKDWMEELSLESPVTVDDWHEVLAAFKEEKGAEAPLCTVGIDDVFKAFAGAYGVGTSYYMDNGEVKFGPIQDGYREFLQLMKTWYDEGLLDPDFSSNDNATKESNILNNRTGAYVQAAGSGIQSMNQKGKAINPDFQLYGVEYPVLNAGEENCFASYTTSSRGSGQAALSRDCRDIEAACRFLNFFYTDEGALLKNFGVEGVCYTIDENGCIEYTDLINNNPDGLSQKQCKAIYMRTDGANPGPIVKTYTGDKEADDALDMWCSHADAILTTTYPGGASLNSEESAEAAMLTANIDAYYQEMTMKFIMGTADLDNDWSSYVDYLNTLGIERMVELKQAAADRYNNK